MKFHCPHCNQRIEAGDEFAGQTGECPNCAGKFPIPAQVSGVDEAGHQHSSGATDEPQAHAQRVQWLVASSAIAVVIAAAVGIVAWIRTTAPVRDVGTPATASPSPAKTTKGAEPQSHVPSTQGRKYSLMMPKEAERFAREKIVGGQFRSEFISSQDLPQGEFHAIGVNIGDGDCVVIIRAFVPAATVIVGRDNIAKVLPIVDRPDIAPLLNPTAQMTGGMGFGRSMRMKGGKEGKSNRGLTEAEEKEQDEKALCFHFAGLLWTTVDLTVTNRVVVRQDFSGSTNGGQWTRKTNIIPKGAYEFCISAIGIVLRRGDNFLICFEAPVKELSFLERKGALAPYDFLLLNEGTDGIRIGSDQMPGASFNVE